MKRSATIANKLTAAILILLFSACAKNAPACEEWEVKDQRSSVGGCIDWSCAGSRTYNLIFCGESLKDATPGNTIVLSEDQCCRRTRTFVQFIRKVN